MSRTTRSGDGLSLSEHDRPIVGDGARAVALSVLTRVELDGAYANLLLPTVLTKAGLHGREAGLATELTYGTLRGQGLYDAVLQYCARRSINQIEQALRPLMRMGVHQILGMRVPAHAAVDESVKLARSAVGQRASGFVNAVLRAVAERDVDQWLTELVPTGQTDTIERLSVAHSHPEWVVRALRESLVGAGRDVTEIDDLLAANNTAAVVTLALLPGITSLDDCADEALSPGSYSPVAVTCHSADPRGIDLVRQGSARVQDEGSQLAALITANAPLDGPDGQWLDMCAGPGGKAALLAATANTRGAHLTACELQEHRTALVREALNQLTDNTTIVTGDARELAQDNPNTYDRVLVDAPCTGLGVLRRRPESRWRREPADLARLAPTQRELLDAAIHATRPGGIITYVTCSPHPAETRLVVNDMLRQHDTLSVLDAPAILNHVATDEVHHAVGPELGTGRRKNRSVQLWPHLHNTDAMFVAVLRKAAV